MFENASTLNVQAINLAEHGDYHDAILCFKRAITIENDNYLLWFNLGLVYHNAGELEMAKSALKKAIMLNEDDIDILENLYSVCYELGENDEALKYCMQCLSINECDSNAWNMIGVIFFNDGFTEEASCAFENAVMHDPFYYEALKNLRSAYKELGNKIGVAFCEENLKNIKAK